MNISSEDLKTIINEEMHNVFLDYKKKHRLDEISFKQFIVGLLIAKAGLAPSAANASVENWNIDNQIVNSQMQKGDTYKAVTAAKSVQKSESGDEIQDSMMEMTTEQCKVSLEEVSMKTKEVSGKELSIDIKCNNGLKYLFVLSKVKGKEAQATLKVKAPNNKNIEGNFTGKEALQKAGSALDYAKKSNPEIQKGVSSFQRANVK
tara:strand:+ start:656 stop:1270 length:615 start_codon:yes stop_codon:yes gene_type:complete